MMSTRYKRTDWVRRLEDFSSGCSSGLRLGRLLLAWLLAGFISSLAYAVPITTNYQGYLESAGAPLNATVDMTFALYDEGTVSLWTETHQDVEVSNGVFSLVLGSITAFNDKSLKDGRFLGIAVGGDAEMSPRQELTSGFSALRAGVADSVKTASVDSEAIADGAVTAEKIAPQTITGDKIADLSGHNVTELDDVADVGSGKIITDAEREKLGSVVSDGSSPTFENLDVKKHLKVGENSIHLDSFTVNNAPINEIYTTDGPLLIQKNSGENVGIGTDAPKAKLDIKGGLNIAATTHAGVPTNPEGGLFLYSEFKSVNESEASVVSYAPKGGVNSLEIVGSPMEILSYDQTQSGSNKFGLVNIVGGPIRLRSANVSIGLPLASHTNQLDVAGSVAIGSKYAGKKVSPANGLLVEGNVGIGTANLIAKLNIDSSGNNADVINFKHSAGQLLFSGYGGELSGTGMPANGTNNLILKNLHSSPKASSVFRFVNKDNAQTLSLESYSVNDLESTWNVLSAHGDLWLHYSGNGFNIIRDDGKNPRIYAQTFDKLGQASFGRNVGIRTGASDSFALVVAGNAYSTGTWTGSDLRWKKNISTIQAPLEKVLQLRGVNYEWKTEEYSKKGFNEGLHIGFIAQEVEKVIPELVSTDDEGYKSVSYENMTAVLVEAVKELKTQNDALKAIVCKDHPEEAICQ